MLSPLTSMTPRFISMRNVITLLILVFTVIIFSNASATPYSISKNNQNVELFIKQHLTQDRYDLVMFWATYCEPCKKDFKKIAQLMKEYPDIHISIIGVVIDGEDNPHVTERLIQEHQLNYAHVLTNFDAANTYHTSVADNNLLGTPSYLLYDHENNLIAEHESRIDLDALLMLIED